MGPVCLSGGYLETCSEVSLESYELSRLNRASNLRKKMSEMIEEWVQCEVDARVARLTMESKRRDLRDSSGPVRVESPEQLTLVLRPVASFSGHDEEAVCALPSSHIPHAAQNGTPFSPADDSPVTSDGLGCDAAHDLSQHAPHSSLSSASTRELVLQDERDALHSLNLFLYERLGRLAHWMGLRRGQSQRQRVCGCDLQVRHQTRKARHHYCTRSISLCPGPALRSA